MSVLKTIKDNPLSAITTGIAIAGVLVSIFNFYILNRLEPIADRVKAVEEDNAALIEQHEEQSKVIGRFLIVENKVIEIDKKIDRIESKLDSLFIPR